MLKAQIHNGVRIIEGHSEQLRCTVRIVDGVVERWDPDPPAAREPMDRSARRVLRQQLHGCSGCGN